METKVNYIIVGLFVIILSSLLVSGLFWLGVRSPTKEYTLYTVYMTESVSGLSIDAPVKYRGVDVGRVKRIRLKPEDPEQVELQLEIDRNTPIRVDTVATLAFQGITGIAHINLTGNDPGALPLVRRDNEPYPVIASTPSLLIRLDEGLSRLIHNLSAASESLAELASGAERQSLANILRNTETITAAIAGRNAEIDAAIRDAARLLDSGTTAGKEIKPLLDKIDQAGDSVIEMSREIGRLAAQVGDKSVHGIETIERSVGDTENILRSVAIDLQLLLGSLQELVIDLKNNPDLLLKGRPPQPAGPGE